MLGRIGNVSSRRLKIPFFKSGKGNSPAGQESYDGTYPDPMVSKADKGNEKAEHFLNKLMPARSKSEDGEVTRPTFHRPRRIRRMFKRDPEPPELAVAPKPQTTHLANLSEMWDAIHEMGDRHRYPEEWEDYMEYAIENGVGLSPENPHIIYSESGKAVTSCVCDPEMPFVLYHHIEENDGEPMCCQCGYYFKLERTLVAPEGHTLMSIPDEGWFDPRLYRAHDHTYRSRPSDFISPAKDVYKEAGYELPLNSGLAIYEKARIQYDEHQKMITDDSAPKFVLDYRQKPKGIKNYSMMEMRQIDDSGEYETLLLPEDEGEANRFLFGTDDPVMLAEAKEQHKLALKHGTEDPKLIKEAEEGQKAIGDSSSSKS